MSFESLLRLIKVGDPVSAGVANRPLRQVDQNVKYIWEVLQAAAIGSTVYAYRQAVEEDAKVGMAVYFNTARQRFERGLASAEVNNTTGAVVTSDSSQVWGILTTKHSGTSADILLFGVDEVDISQAVAGTPAAGTYYLSSSAPGKLTATKPPVAVAVLRRTPDGKVFVQPQFIDYLDRHTHYRFDLRCAPAGTHVQPSLGDLHRINDPDPDRTGWLPADHPVFAGLAPTGAVFGYNLNAQPGLKAVWPPVPLGNAILEWNKALSADVGFTGVPLGTDGLCVLNRDGIWWMSNCYGDVPWPISYGTGNSESASDSVGAECPRLVAMEMRLFFSKVNFATDSAVVLSLASGDARVKVHCYGDTERPATTGHLQITLDLNLVVKNDEPGYLALKGFNAARSEFARGPVVEGLFSLSSNVTLVGQAQTTRTVDAVPRTIQHGLVSVTVDPADTKELEVQLVRLDGAEEAHYGEPPVMYLEFIEGDDREYRGKIHVPYDLAIPSPEMSLRFVVLGRAAGTLPQLEFTGRIVPRATDGLDTPMDLPQDVDEFSITCVTVADLTDTNQYVEAESEPFAVAAGDTVYFTVKREASDGYAAAVGILRHSGVVATGA